MEETKNKFLTPNSTITAGDIQFFDAIEPPLLSGSYNLKAEQAITGVVNEDGSKPAPYLADKSFLVQGPQFSISLSAVHTQYPAPLTIGRFGTDMPNIVLTDMSLPWSRPIDPLNPDDNLNVPWMGLLTIYPNEMDIEATELSATNKVSKPKSVTISELLNPGGSTLGPTLDEADIKEAMDTKLTVVDMDFKLFQSITPKINELPFLAHGRAVNTDGKVMLGMEGDGYFSLLVGNRLPKSGTPTEPAVNTMLMVSFEGFSKYLRGGSAAPSGIDSVRLVLLNSWNFKVTEAEASFLNMMSNLCEKNRGGVKLMQMPGASNATDATAKKALEIGYNALQNNMRVGETATSWYRGPMVPAPTLRDDFSDGTYLYSDHAMHYDPSTGIFNHAYSAAWQIGRLLALSDGSFANSFFDWRNSYINSINRQASQQGVDINSQKIGAAVMLKPDDKQKLVTSVRSLFTNQIKDINWPKVETRSKTMLGNHLPGVLSEQEKKTIFNNDEDPLLSLLKK